MSVSTSIETQKFTVTLPRDVVDILHAKVTSGEYTSDAEFVEAAIVESILKPVPSPQDGLDEWIRTEGMRRLKHLHADPSSGSTVEEVEAYLNQTEEEDFREAPKAG
jgi:Arc/MetJ-type ribon-helix-helix transcriptional regulator